MGNFGASKRVMNWSENIVNVNVRGATTMRKCHSVARPHPCQLSTRQPEKQLMKIAVGSQLTRIPWWSVISPDFKGGQLDQIRFSNVFASAVNGCKANFGIGSSLPVLGRRLYTSNEEKKVFERREMARPTRASRPLYFREQNAALLLSQHLE